MTGTGHPVGEPREWVVQAPPEAVRSLLEILNEDFRAAEAPKAKAFRIALEVARIDGIKLEVFAREEGQPHFRAIVEGMTANFSLRDGSVVIGDIGRHEKKVRKWFAIPANRQLMIDSWNERRPADCPVGKYRDD